MFQSLGTTDSMVISSHHHQLLLLLLILLHANSVVRFVIYFS